MFLEFIFTFYFQNFVRSIHATRWDTCNKEKLRNDQHYKTQRVIPSLWSDSSNPRSALLLALSSFPEAFTSLLGSLWPRYVRDVLGFSFRHSSRSFCIPLCSSFYDPFHILTCRSVLSSFFGAVFLRTKCGLFRNSNLEFLFKNSLSSYGR
jgi:hypothetical protein